MSQDIDFDTLEVTFWGVDFFKNRLNKEVLYGTTLYWPIQRQFGSDEDSKQASWMADSILLSGFIPCLLLIGPILTAGSLLPTWVFLNSL